MALGSATKKGTKLDVANCAKDTKGQDRGENAKLCQNWDENAKKRGKGRTPLKGVRRQMMDGPESADVPRGEAKNHLIISPAEKSDDKALFGGFRGLNVLILVF